MLNLIFILFGFFILIKTFVNNPITNDGRLSISIFITCVMMGIAFILLGVCV